MDDQKNMQVLTTVRKDILSKIMIENQIDLIGHSYYIVFDIKEFHPQSGNSLRETRVVNLYDNKFRKRKLWERSATQVR